MSAAVSEANSGGEMTPDRGLRGDLRAVLFPEKKLHYWWYFLVLVVALSYWIASVVKHPDGSWAEYAMYRAEGDNQVYPAITALSRLNFGDPTDAFYQGEGVAGFQVVILFPYALAYAVFGAPGYMVADVLLSLIYFVAVSLLLRRCNFSIVPCFMVACFLATGSLQNLSHKFGQIASATLATSGMEFSEWAWPDLLRLLIFPKRIPRPMVTEIFVVLCLYFLLKQWQQRQMPSFWRGLALGVSLAAVAQGDPYSCVVLGLLLLWMGVSVLAGNRWRVPWAALGGLVLGSLACGWYFILQRMCETPDAAVRFGLAEFPRSELVPLPGLAPVVRVAAIALLGYSILWMTRRSKCPDTLPKSETRSPRKRGKAQVVAAHSSAQLEPPAAVDQSSGARSVAWFWMAAVVAAWFAQPVQLWIFGKGAQIYHYLLFTLPTFYSYALLILLYNLYRLGWPAALAQPFEVWMNQSRASALLFLAPMSLAILLLGIELPLTAVWNHANARQDRGGPWAVAGDKYRPAFRALDQEFRKNPVLRQSRTFGTFNPEVNFLLTAFHHKRAFLPDNAYTTLDDYRLEERLCEFAKLLAASPDDFVGYLSSKAYMLNFWAGCAKYWMGTEHQFAPDSDYEAGILAKRDLAGKQSPWGLSIPISERLRYYRKHAFIMARQSNVKRYPEIIVLDAEERRIGMLPFPQLYKECYTNEAFAVFEKQP